MAIGSFTRLLRAVADVFENEVNNTVKLTEVLKSCLYENGLVGDDLWANAECEIAAIPLEVLLPKYQQVVHALFKSCKQCLEEMQSGFNGPAGNVANINGEMFLFGGLLQTFLLSPQGPVDPAEKQNFLLKYAEEEVTIPSSSINF